MHFLCVTGAEPNFVYKVENVLKECKTKGHHNTKSDDVVDAFEFILVYETYQKVLCVFLDDTNHHGFPEDFLEAPAEGVGKKSNNDTQGEEDKRFFQGFFKGFFVTGNGGFPCGHRKNKGDKGTNEVDEEENKNTYYHIAE